MTVNMVYNEFKLRYMPTAALTLLVTNGRKKKKTTRSAFQNTRAV